MDLCVPSFLQKDENSYSVLRCERNSVILPKLTPSTKYVVSVQALTQEGHGAHSVEHEFETLAEREFLGGGGGLNVITWGRESKINGEGPPGAKSPEENPGVLAMSAFLANSISLTSISPFPPQALRARILLQSLGVPLLAASSWPSWCWGLSCSFTGGMHFTFKFCLSEAGDGKIVVKELKVVRGSVSHGVSTGDSCRPVASNLNRLCQF